jgi:pyruvate/2-oxoglutarate dehydrogenase complex dihydrolipoamide acyltransferase (E2) component
VDISDAFVAQLKAQSTRVCPLVCPKGKVADGDRCIAAENPPRVARQKEDEEKPSQKSKPQLSRRSGDTEPSRPQQAKRERPAAHPRVSEQASSYSGGGHSTGGGGATIGVGF